MPVTFLLCFITLGTHFVSKTSRACLEHLLGKPFGSVASDASLCSYEVFEEMHNLKASYIIETTAKPRLVFIINYGL